MVARIRPAHDDLPRLISVEEGASALGIHPKTFRRYIADGTFAAYRLPTSRPGAKTTRRAVRVDQAEVLAFIARARQEQAR